MFSCFCPCLFQRILGRKHLPSRFKLVLGRFYVSEFRQLKHKSYFVSTPIFYANASPHIGHLYTAALADASCRWQELKDNKESKLISGCDEHGLKVWKAAETHGLEPDAYCNRISER